MNFKLITLWLIMALAVLSTEGFATITINTSMQAKGQFNDNIYLLPSDDENKTSDYISFLLYNSDLNYHSSLLDITMESSFEKRNYLHNTEQNEDVSAYNFGVQLRPIRDLLYVNLGTIQTRIPLDSRRVEAFNNIIRNQTEQRGLFIAPYISRQLTKTLFFKGGYTYSDTTFKLTSGASGAGDDTKDYNTFGELAKQWTDKLTTSFRFNRLKHDIQSQTNIGFYRYDYSIAATFKANRRLNFSGELGRHWFNFNPGPVEPADFGNLQGSYKLSPNKTMTLGYSLSTSSGSGYRSNSGFEVIAPPPEPVVGPTVETVDAFDEITAGISRVSSWNMTFTRKGNINSTFTASATDTDYPGGDREDSVRSASLMFARRLTGRLDFTLRGVFQRQKLIGPSSPTRQNATTRSTAQSSTTQPQTASTSSTSQSPTTQTASTSSTSQSPTTQTASTQSMTQSSSTQTALSNSTSQTEALQNRAANLSSEESRTLQRALANPALRADLLQSPESLSGLQKTYRYNVEASFLYRITPDISARIAYNFNTNHSNREQSEFNNNVIWLNIGWSIPNVQRFFPF